MQVKSYTDVPPLFWTSRLQLRKSRKLSPTNPYEKDASYIIVYRGRFGTGDKLFWIYIKLGRAQRILSLRH